MAGLYIKNNLGETNLNLVDAVQKLYKTGIENDIRLFAFARSLFSEVRSPFIFNGETISAEISGLKNEPFTKGDGTVVNRTKFITTDFTFSENNFIWFERIASGGGFQLDRRESSYDVALNGSVAAASSPANHIQLDSSDAQALSSTQHRLVGYDADGNSTIYFILGSITSGGVFQISSSFDGTALTGAGLTAALQNLQATNGASIRYMRPEGSPIVISENGSLVSLEISSVGSNYDIQTFHTNGNFVIGRKYTIFSVGDMDWNAVGVPTGTDAVRGLTFTATAVGDGAADNTGTAYTTLPTSSYTGINNTKAIQVAIVGEISGASNAVAEVYLKSDGSLDATQLPKIILGGSGYIEEENLTILFHCQTNRYGEAESPGNTKCKNYPNNADRIIHNVFNYTTSDGDALDNDNTILDNTIEIGFEATFKAAKYYYEVKVGTEDGFFLYNPDDDEFVYLGELYDSLQTIPVADEPVLKLRREDRITNKNLLNIASLDSRSFIFTHDNEESFTFADSLSSGLRSISLDVSEIRNNFQYIVQNAKRQRTTEDQLNTLSTQYNIFQGRNFDSTYRCVLRDPDGVLDATGANAVDFSTLSQLNNVDEIETTINGEKVICPGIYLDVGGEYRRAFSTDDKPFASAKGKKILSPKFYKLADGQTDYSNDSNYELVQAGDARYSLHTAYYKGGSETSVIGFDMYLGTLVQNISNDLNNGGFVFDDAKSTETIKTGVESFPLFSYISGGTTFSPRFLYTTDAW